jgi:hypothetical protein
MALHTFFWTLENFSVRNNYAQVPWMGGSARRKVSTCTVDNMSIE